jgi:hypothetical protein
MEAIRKVYRQLPDTLKMPKNLQNQRVEVILLPLDSVSKSRSAKSKTSPIACFAGAWAGEILVREDQGNYELREELK